MRVLTKTRHQLAKSRWAGCGHVSLSWHAARVNHQNIVTSEYFTRSTRLRWTAACTSRVSNWYRDICTNSNNQIVSADPSSRDGLTAKVVQGRSWVLWNSNLIFARIISVLFWARTEIIIKRHLSSLCSICQVFCRLFVFLNFSLVLRRKKNISVCQMILFPQFTI